jgi:hypothetical protein
MRKFGGMRKFSAEGFSFFKVKSAQKKQSLPSRRPAIFADRKELPQKYFLFFNSVRVQIQWALTLACLVPARRLMPQVLQSGQ